MIATVSFALTPRERRQALLGTFAGVLRDTMVGLPIAAAGVALVTWRVKPGAAGGWGVILTILGIGILAIPYMGLLRSLGSAKHRASRNTGQVHVTLTDTSLKYTGDGYTAEWAWQHVTGIRSTANCWIITIRNSPAALVLPKRAVPAALESEVTAFLEHWRTWR